MTTSDIFGNAPLHLAASRGHADIVDLLVSRGADMTAANRNGNTALHLAARYGHADIVEILER